MASTPKGVLSLNPNERVVTVERSQKRHPIGASWRSRGSFVLYRTNIHATIEGIKLRMGLTQITSSNTS